MSSLQGKRAVVSGSSRGIGRGIAIELAKAGADVVINYRSHGDEADEVIKQCEAAGAKAYKVAADLAVQSEVESLIDQACDLMGGLDIVVSNAAYSDRHLMLESDMAEFRKTIDISMWGAVLSRSRWHTENGGRRKRWKCCRHQQPPRAHGDARRDGLQHVQSCQRPNGANRRVRIGTTPHSLQYHSSRVDRHARRTKVLYRRNFGNRIGQAALGTTGKTIRDRSRSRFSVR